jgi:hypothetical protein
MEGRLRPGGGKTPLGCRASLQREKALSMNYVTTRHLWPQERDGKIAVSNVNTERRVLLSPDELPQLEAFSGPAQGDGAMAARLREADLIVASEGQATPVDNPRQTALLFAVDRFLAEERGTSRSRVQQATPDPLERLQEVRARICGELGRKPRAGDYWRKRSVAEDVSALFDHARTFLSCDAGDAGAFPFPTGFLSASAGRPLPRYDYEQQPCMPATTAARVALAGQSLRPDSRCLMLGDDDLISLLWSQQVPHPADVFELDTQLIDFLKPRLRQDVTIFQRDLTQGLPPEFHSLYDVVFTDPMYRADGMDLFMACAASGLSDHPEARVYFSTRPDLIQEGDRLEERLEQAGLAVCQQHRNFNRYLLPNFARNLILRDFMGSGMPMQLIDGLLRIPYLYADLFVLRKA